MFSFHIVHSTMNNMKSKASPSELRKLSMSVGNCIRYWGFRRIHGAIWTQLYLSNTPLNCTALTRNLKVSKSLVSPALEELVKYRLIEEVPSENEKTKHYTAAENISEVIQHVLRTRESKMLKKITDDFHALSKVSKKDMTIDADRLNSLNEMILSANLMLGVLLSQPDIMQLPEYLNLSPAE